MTDTQHIDINQELEEMIQSIEDEIYNTRTFNSNLEKEIAYLRNELGSLCRHYYKKDNKE